MKLFYLFFFVVLCISACNSDKSENNTAVDDNSNPAPPLISYSVVKVYQHDTSSYTEGLEWVNNSLYESGGNYGTSKLFSSRLDGSAIKSIDLSKEYFGEGITVLNNKVYQLTYREHKVFVYDATTLKKINELNWPHEGWGMTNDSKNLIISTGSSNIYFVEPETFRILNQISVTDNYGPVSFVNELEYANNYIYANVYETDYILKIDPQTGNVAGRIDLSGLLQKSGMKYNPQNYTTASGNVLNGIAYDSSKNSFYVTGKMWPALFEIKLNN